MSHMVAEGTQILLSSRDRALLITTFLTSGIASLLAWNCVVNSFVALQRIIWPGEVFSDLLGGTEYSMATLVAFGILRFNASNIKLVYISGFLNVAVGVCFPLVVHLYAGLEHIKIAKILLVCVALVAGAGSSLCNVVGYSLASLMPHNAVAFVSTGNGAAGVFTFATFLTLSELVFSKTVQGQKYLLWCFFSLGICVIIIHMVCIFKLNKRIWFHQIVDEAKPQLKATQDQPLEEFESVPPRSFSAIFKDCGIHASSACLTVIITLLVFPLVGPYHWNQSYTVTTLLNGTFQVTNMIMRYSPALCSWIRIKKTWLFPLVIGRALFFIPLFLTPARFVSDTSSLKSPIFLIFLMLVFTSIHGCSVTLAALYCGTSVSNPKEKTVASKILVIGMLIGSLIGTFGSKLFVM